LRLQIVQSIIIFVGWLPLGKIYIKIYIILDALGQIILEFHTGNKQYKV
jgi:hypothetical protein